MAKINIGTSKSTISKQTNKMSPNFSNVLFAFKI
jgi:hypothetical protein